MIRVGDEHVDMASKDEKDTAFPLGHLFLSPVLFSFVNNICNYSCHSSNFYILKKQTISLKAMPLFLTFLLVAFVLVCVASVQTPAANRASSERLD